MPIREPRLELDRIAVNAYLDWSGVSLPSIAEFVKAICVSSYTRINEVYVYNRGQVFVEDTKRRQRECWMISIWSGKIGEPNAECLFQQPVPLKLRLTT